MRPSGSEFQADHVEAGVPVVVSREAFARIRSLRGSASFRQAVGPLVARLAYLPIGVAGLKADGLRYLTLRNGYAELSARPYTGCHWVFSIAPLFFIPADPDNDPDPTRPGGGSGQAKAGKAVRRPDRATIIVDGGHNTRLLIMVAIFKAAPALCDACTAAAAGLRLPTMTIPIDLATRARALDACNDLVAALVIAMGGSVCFLVGGSDKESFVPPASPLGLARSAPYRRGADALWDAWGIHPNKQRAIDCTRYEPFANTGNMMACLPRGTIATYKGDATRGLGAKLWMKSTRPTVH